MPKYDLSITPSINGYFTPRVRTSHQRTSPLRAGILTESVRKKVEQARSNLQVLDYEPNNPQSKAIVVDTKN